MKHLKKIIEITNTKQNFDIMQKALQLIEKLLKRHNLVFMFENNQLHVFTQKNIYLYTIGIGDFDNLVLYLI